MREAIVNRVTFVPADMRNCIEQQARLRFHRSFQGTQNSLKKKE